MSSLEIPFGFCSTILCHTRTILEKKHTKIYPVFLILELTHYSVKDLVMVEVMHLNMRILMEPQSFPILAWEVIFPFRCSFCVPAIYLKG